MFPAPVNDEKPTFLHTSSHFNKHFQEGPMNSLLNLSHVLPIKDLRNLMFDKLDHWDRELVMPAHAGPTNQLRVFRNKNFQRWCARLGHIALLKYIKPHVYKCTELCAAAAYGGRLHVITWLVSIGCPIDYSLFPSAAIGGNVEVLEWLKYGLADPGDFEGFATENAAACTNAAEFGHLPAIHWLMQHGFHWDEQTCHEAAQHGHLHVLQWIVDNGCPITLSVAATYAARRGHLHVLQWLAPWLHGTEN
jgi:hypothetical protein